MALEPLPADTPACTCWRGDPAKAPPCSCHHDNPLMPENDNPALPPNFARLADPAEYGEVDAPPERPPMAYILTRAQAVDIIRAARAIIASVGVMELPAGFTPVRSTLIQDLERAMPKGFDL